jgi:Uma2 family endonuclease
MAGREVFVKAERATRVAESPAAYGATASAGTLSPAEQRVVLQNVSWETYRRLLTERGGATTPRFVYDRGLLEIMSPQLKHENLRCGLQDLLVALAEEYDLPFIHAGTLTCSREDLQRGLEPDACFYIAHADAIRGKSEIDLETDPPPDLMLEIDITHSSIDKLPLLAAMGVSEVWLVNAKGIHIHILRKGTYVPQKSSGIFKGLPLPSELPRFLAIGERDGVVAMLKGFRAWLKDARAGSRRKRQ